MDPEPKNFDKMYKYFIKNSPITEKVHQKQGIHWMFETETLNLLSLHRDGEEQINEINEMYSQEMKKETIQEEKVISSEKIHKHVEKHEECEEEEEDPNCKVVRPAEIQERLEAMKKVVLTARANLAAFEIAYNELSELLGSESQV